MQRALDFYSKRTDVTTARVTAPGAATMSQVSPARQGQGATLPSRSPGLTDVTEASTEASVSQSSLQVSTALCQTQSPGVSLGRTSRPTPANILESLELTTTDSDDDDNQEQLLPSGSSYSTPVLTVDPGLGHSSHDTSHGTSAFDLGKTPTRNHATLPLQLTANEGVEKDRLRSSRLETLVKQQAEMIETLRTNQMELCDSLKVAQENMCTAVTKVTELFEQHRSTSSLKGVKRIPRQLSVGYIIYNINMYECVTCVQE